MAEEESPVAEEEAAEEWPPERCGQPGLATKHMTFDEKGREAVAQNCHPGSGTTTIDDAIVID